MAAFRYVALNPMKAGLVTRAEDWPWSSVAAHLAGRDTPYVLVEPALSRGADFAGLVAGVRSIRSGPACSGPSSSAVPSGRRRGLRGLRSGTGVNCCRRSAGPSRRG